MDSKNSWLCTFCLNRSEQKGSLSRMWMPSYKDSKFCVFYCQGSEVTSLGTPYPYPFLTQIFFLVVLGIWTQVLMLLRQSLYQLSYILSPHKIVLTAHWYAGPFSHLPLTYTQVDMVTPIHPKSGLQTVPGIVNSPGSKRNFESSFWPCGWS